jgi:ABC-2 type transport system ATP-binding protein
MTKDKEDIVHITINHLSKVYRGGQRALDHIDLDIPSGMYGLLGPNGAGKTTLIRLLAGILPPTEGTIRIAAYDVNTSQGRTAIQSLLGYLPQDFGAYPDLNAREFLDYVGLLKGMNDRVARRRRIEELLETVALTRDANRKLKTYSGGMKRRVGIAQALLNDPQLLIVDEPTAGLDPEERIRFRNLLADLGGDRTVLLSTHIIEDIAQTCRQLAILRGGHLIFHGSTADLVKEALGKVWMVTTDGPRPQGDLKVVSTLNMGSSMQYRVVGDLAASDGATPTEPSLEDSYIWLMREKQSQSEATTGAAPVRASS